MCLRKLFFPRQAGVPDDYPGCKATCFRVEEERIQSCPLTTQMPTGHERITTNHAWDGQGVLLCSKKDPADRQMRTLRGMVLGGKARHRRLSLHECP